MTSATTKHEEQCHACYWARWLLVGIVVPVVVFSLLYFNGSYPEHLYYVPLFGWLPFLVSTAYAVAHALTGNLALSRFKRLGPLAINMTIFLSITMPRVLHLYWAQPATVVFAEPKEPIERELPMCAAKLIASSSPENATLQTGEAGGLLWIFGVFNHTVWSMVTDARNRGDSVIGEAAVHARFTSWWGLREQPIDVKAVATANVLCHYGKLAGTCEANAVGDGKQDENGIASAETAISAVNKDQRASITVTAKTSISELLPKFGLKLLGSDIGVPGPYGKAQSAKRKSITKTYEYMCERIP